MSANSLGLPAPLPITTTFALPLTLYYLILQSRVVAQRVRTKTIIGQETTSSSKSSSDADKPTPDTDPLFIATRAQSNFIENVPLALLLSAFVELNGGNSKFLTFALGALTIARVLHVEQGLLVKGNKGKGRPIGFLTTIGVNLGLAGYGAWLVRGYWGL